jgi:hypothetical protein
MALPPVAAMIRALPVASLRPCPRIHAAVQFRLRSRLVQLAQVAAIEVLREADRPVQKLLVQPNRGIVEDDIGLPAGLEHLGPEGTNRGAARRLGGATVALGTPGEPQPLVTPAAAFYYRSGRT